MTLYAKRNLCYQGGLIRQGEHVPAGVKAEFLDRWAEEGAVAPVPVISLPDLTPMHTEERVYGPVPPPAEPTPIPVGAIAGDVEIVDLPGFSFSPEPAIVGVGPIGGPTLDEMGQPLTDGPAELASEPAAETTPVGSELSPEDGPAGTAPAGAETIETTPSGDAGQPAPPTPPAAETKPGRSNRPRR